MTFGTESGGRQAELGRREMQVLNAFYRTGRAGKIGLSDGGGPFGFDVHLALLVDQIVSTYSCDAVVETGCYLGDTTDYLTRMYPTTPVWSCDIYRDHAEFTARRLGDRQNLRIECCDGAELVALASAQFALPLLFLDAHGIQDDWPLARELGAAKRAIVIIHDFDIGHDRFSFDTYDGVACGPQLLAGIEGMPARYFTPNPDVPWSLPCLQTGRRAGYAMVALDVDDSPLHAEPHLRAMPLAVTA